MEKFRRDRADRDYRGGTLAAIYKVVRTQRLALSLEEAWEFFSDPINLPKITPSWLGFRPSPPDRAVMHPGMILQYTLTPMGPIPIHWVTEITHVQEPFLFVDEQRFGPYRLWHHQHHFQETTGGVEMTDIVHYSLPWGPVGRFLHFLTVRDRVREIFDFRYEVLERMFGVASERARST